MPTTPGGSSASEPPRFEDVWARADAIGGWMTEGQGRLLFDSALNLTSGARIVEIGSHQGRSTVVLGLAGSRDRARQARGYVEELGARSLPESLDYLRELDPRIRAGLCDALSNAGVVDALTAIEPLARDRDPQVAASAARAVAILKRQRR